MRQAPDDPEFLLRHVAHVRQLARRLVFDADLAREVEQETWVAALEHAPRDLRQPRAWLSRVARHVARRLWARKDRSQGLERVAGRERHAARTAAEKTPPDLVEREQALRRLLAAIDRLPEPVRTTVVMHHLDGLSLRDVAHRTKAPLETVRSRSKRGLALLREDLTRRNSGRATWSLALVRGLELAPPHPGRGLILCVRELLLPLTVMNTGLKLVTATGGAALLLVATWTWIEREPAASPRTPGPSVEEFVAGDLGLPAQEEGRRAPLSPTYRTGAPMSAAPQPVAEPTTGEIAIELVWAADGRPAADVPLRFEARELDPGRGTWHTSTEDGTVFLEDLPPSRYMLQTLFGGLEFAEVVAGETSDVRLSIPVGLEVAGRVRDADGTPVADAGIYLWPGSLHPMYEAMPVARSDVLGEFALPCVPAGVTAALSARALRRAPTQQVMLTGDAGSAVEIELVFQHPGRSVAGIVVGPDGLPLEGAEVVVGSEREVALTKRSDGTLAYPPIGELVRTGPDGRFEVEGAARGELPVQARGRGYAPWKGRLAEGERWLEIRLERGSWVRGVVRNADGGVPARATVNAGPSVFFASHSAHMRADGSYEIGPLASGGHELIAIGVDGETAKIRLTLRARMDQVWDPVLGGGPEVRGWIEAPGEDLAGWTVRGYAEPRPGEMAWSESCRSEADGTFVLRNVPEREVHLSLYSPGAPFWVASVPGVVAGGAPVVLRPDPERWPTSFVTGRLVDEQGAPITSADLWLRSEEFGSTLIHPDREDGSFRLGPMPAGTWVLEQDPLIAGWAVGRTSFTLMPEEKRELGALKLGPGGSLEVTVHREAEASGVLSLDVVDEDGRRVERLTIEGRTATSRPLVPGIYRLMMLESAGKNTRELVITAGGVTPVEVDVP